MPVDPSSANFYDFSPSQSLGYLLNVDSVASEEMLFSQNILPYSDSLYLYELLLMETPLNTWSTDVNDNPTIRTVCSVSTSPPPPSPPPPPQVATFCSPRWHKIPQTIYSVNHWNFIQLQSILFLANGLPGVNMGDALCQNFAALQGRDDIVFQDVGIAISFRLWFPGYPLGGSQISTRYWHKGRNPINRSKLAHQVAKKLKKYLDSMRASHVMDPSTDGKWEIGEGFMHLRNMFLAKLVHVTRGSFQAELWVMDDTM